MNQIVLLGHTGLLGTAIRALAEERNRYVLYVKSRELSADLDRARLDLLPGIDRLDPNLGIDVICAAGVLDPAAPKDDLMNANLRLPLTLFQSLSKPEAVGSDVRFVTVGSIHETNPDISASNEYIRSKRELSAKHKELALVGLPTWHHIRLHTLYGGDRTHPHMFLGEVETALRHQVAFEMSDGEQLREYHHTDDVARNLLDYLDSGATTSSIVDFSSGDPISLRELASSIFKEFGRENLLKIGVRAAPSAEIYENCYERSPHLHSYRPMISGVNAWLVSRLVESP